MAIEVQPAVSPYLIVDDAAAAIDFYVAAFGAEELGRVPGPDGKLVNAALRINGSVVMLNDDFPEMTGGKSMTPKSLGGTPVYDPPHGDRRRDPVPTRSRRRRHRRRPARGSVLGRPLRRPPRSVRAHVVARPTDARGQHRGDRRGDGRHGVGHAPDARPGLLGYSHIDFNLGGPMLDWLAALIRPLSSVAFTMASEPVSWVELLGFLTGGLCVALTVRGTYGTSPSASPTARSSCCSSPRHASGPTPDCRSCSSRSASPDGGSGCGIAAATHPLVVTRAPRREMAWCVGFVVLGTAALFVVLRAAHDSAPLLDAFTTCLSACRAMVVERQANSDLVLLDRRGLHLRPPVRRPRTSTSPRSCTSCSSGCA